MILILVLSGCREEQADPALAALTAMSLPERIAQTLVVPISADTAMLGRFDWGGVMVGSGDAIDPSRRRWLDRRDSVMMPLVVASVDTDVGGELGIDLALTKSLPTLGDQPLPPAALYADAAREEMAEWVTAAREAGVTPVLELFWSEDTVPEALRWDRARFSAIELAALESALDAGAGGVLPGMLVLPALTGDSTPLAYSAAGLAGMLRRRVGPERLILARINGPGEPAENAVRALAAGADLLVGADDPDAVIQAVSAAIADGRIAEARVYSAALRVLRHKFERSPRGVPPLPDTAGGDLAITPQPLAPSLQQVDPSEVGMSEVGLAAVDAIIREAIEDSIFPGAALAVGRSGGLVRLRGYGQLDYTENSPEVDGARTLYDLASLSKIIGTTAAVMNLVEEGRLDLDAPVQKYISEFEGGGKSAVTLRHLLTHTSGLPAGIWLYGSARSSEEAMRQVIQQPLKWEPGERVQYSDLGMILMAEIAERAAEMPLDQYLALRVYAPLGMSSTMYLPPIVFQPQIAPTAADTERPFVLQGIVHDANSFRLGGIAGHAGIFSTARDIAVFALTMLNHGRYGHVALYDSATVDQFTTRQPGAEQRALGWDTPSRLSSAGQHFSEESFGHTGYTGTSLWIEPTKDLFVVFLTNRTYSGGSAGEIFRIRRAVHEAVARAIAG